MIHDLDLALELVRSEVAEVRATGVPILTPHVDIANARVEFANGAVAIITASRVSRERTRKLRIFQPTGYFSLDLAQGSGHFYRLKSGWQGFGATRIEEIVEHVRLVAPEALGGPLLERAGVRVLDRMESYSVVGFVEALAKIPAHYRLLNRIKRSFKDKRYDLVILVDYPGYHLRAAAAAAAAGIPVLYYIAPQMWAWGPGRVRKLAAVKRLAVILPFEEQFFRARGVAATFVGHPLRDRPPLPPRAETRTALGLDPSRPVLGLFPGSRRQEVVR